VGWDTADQLKKGIVGSYNRKSRGLGWETADQLKKRDRGLREVTGKPLTRWKIRSWAQGEGKPLRKRGRKVQSPILGTGVGIKG